MAAVGALLDSCSEQFSHDQANHGVYRCDNCVTLESQLREALLESSASKFIIKLLYKWLNDASAKSVRPSMKEVISTETLCETVSEHTSIETLCVCHNAVNTIHPIERNRECVNPVYCRQIQIPLVKGTF
jgi:hypothetical protein